MVNQREVLPRIPKNPRIVMSRVPLRISFVGGGSDLPGKSENLTGETYSAAIDQYVYVMAKWRNDDRVIMNWREKEDVPTASDLNHDLAREALKMLGVGQGIEIATFADVPGVGSGLGSSAATTVAIVQAVSSLTGINLDSERLARAAVEIELVRLGREGGSQDQWTSAIGGVCRLSHTDGRCTGVEHVCCSRTTRGLLKNHFALFSPPRGHPGRNADDVLATKIENDQNFRKVCRNLVDKFSSAVQEDDWKECGNLLGQHNALKRSAFGGYYPAEGSELIELGVDWKLCGAGASGHLLVAVTPETRSEIVAAVEGIWGKELPWSVSDRGAEVVYAI